MSSPQVDWFSQNAPTDPIQAAMGRKPIPKTDDWFAANSPAIGPNDPNGNYDFGAFGKVKGARMNGHVATRAEAFHSMDTINGLAQSMAQSVQQHQQAFEDLRKSFTTDQMTKDVMADLAGIAVAGGASKLAGLGRWTALAPQLEKSALGETVQTAAKPVSRDWFAENAPGIGPGTAHVTDPAFLTGKAMGAHADHLNGLSDAPGRLGNLSGVDIADYNGKIRMGARPDRSDLFTQPEMTAGNMVARYNTDPEFQKLADAARMYVHNYTSFGDIDKLTLGMKPAHTYIAPGKAAPEMWDVDPDTTMFDGTRWGGDQISTHTGAQMAETLYSAIREATERNIPLYRGITPYGGVDKLVAGDTLTLPLSSFSDNQIKAATQFGSDFVFELEGPSKHLNIKPFNSMDEGEHLTQGHFEVTGVGTKTIEIPPFWKDEPPTFHKFRYVKIRQKGVM